jgi:hypothetical protein
VVWHGKFGSHGANSLVIAFSSTLCKQHPENSTAPAAAAAAAAACAAIGRGMNDVAFRAHAIQASIERMLNAAALPVLTDLKLEIQGLTHLELFPDPIPDVFVGQPLLVSGKFAGQWPEAVHLVGMLPTGEGG